MGASVDVYLLCCVISKNISLEDGSLRLPPYGGEDVGGNLVVLHFLPIFFYDKCSDLSNDFFPSFDI